MENTYACLAAHTNVFPYELFRFNGILWMRARSVLSRSAFNHSMNYRSVVAFGIARKVVDAAEKIESLQIISEHLIPGRWAEVRAPNTKELKATSVLEFLMEEASSKVRTGPPVDDTGDYGFPVWAGILPLAIRSRQPIPDVELSAAIALPDYVLRYDARPEGPTQVPDERVPGPKDEREF